MVDTKKFPKVICVTKEMHKFLYLKKGQEGHKNINAILEDKFFKKKKKKK